MMNEQTPAPETPKQAAKRFMTANIKRDYRPEALHVYTDIEGNPLYWRIRMKRPDTGDKLIRPMRCINGQYELKEPEYPNGKPLYNLHQIAKRTDDVVWLVEGEKCADALIKLGLLATTSGGADSVDKAFWQSIGNREVLIWPDNDVPGLGYADKARAKLKPLSCKINQLDIAVLNLPAKGDCVDWIAAFTERKGYAPTADDVWELPVLESTPDTQTDAHNHATSDYLQAGEITPLPQSNDTPATALINDDEVIAKLAALKPLEYDRVRNEQAKALKVRPATLDSMVKLARDDNEQDNSPFADIDPWHEPINPAQLLDDITGTIQRFIVLDKHQAQAAALWVSTCWFIDLIHTAPIALINAPERACGKTQLLTVLGKLAPRTAQASSISPSVLFRMIEAYQPTLFIDEVETILKDNEDLRGLINAGHTRDSAKVWRSVAKGDDFEPKCFSVWGMKAVAGINAIKLAETVTSRSIVFELRRKKPNETVSRLRHAESGLFDELAAKLARFADDYASEVQKASPHLPDDLGDRDQDNWEPLLSVADVAGGHWPQTARQVALKLCGAMQTPQSAANELLADIQEIFESKHVLKISTADLIAALTADDERSWATYNRGKPISAKQIANRLAGYGIKSKTVRLGYETAKGFEMEQFADAFARYLSDPLNLPSQGNNPLEANSDKALDVTDAKNVTVTQSEKETLEPTPMLDCDGVTVKTPIFGENAQTHNDDGMRF